VDQHQERKTNCEQPKNKPQVKKVKTNMKHLYQTTLLCLLLTTAALAQTFKPTSHWRAGSTGSDGIWDIAIDTAGNQYICGYFTGTVDVDPGPGVYNLTLPAGQTQEDAFLLKLDVNGNFVWAKSFGGTVDAERVARGLQLDHLGNVYVFGYYGNNIRFTAGGTLWSTSASGSGNSSPFLVKFNPSGNLLWGYGWSGITNSDGFIYDIQIDQTLNIYAAGLYQGTIDFDPIVGSANVISKTSVGLYDMFLLKISQTGEIKKVKTNGSVGHDGFSGIALSENNTLFIGGTFSNTLDVDWGAGVSNITSVDAIDLFVIKLDTALNFKWVKPFGGQGIEYMRDLKLKNGTLAILGSFFQNIDLDPSPSASSTHMSNGDRDCFIQRLDTNGNYILSKSFGGIGQDEGTSIFLDDLNMSIVGRFNNTVDFDPSPNGTYIISSNGGNDGYVLDLDSNGNFISAAGFGSSAGLGVWENMTAKLSTNLVKGATSGFFFNTIDINPSTLVTQNVSSAGQDDMLYLKLESCTNAFVQSTATACGSSFQLPSGNIVYASGYYLDTVLSSQGCDSTNGITVNLFPLPNATVTQTGATFTAQPGLTYQWLNCQTNQPIAAATNQSFTATANGQYAVIVSNGNCTDTSSCYTLNNIGVQEAHLPVVNLYPNPTTGLLHIESPQPWQKIEITDMLGRNLLTQNQPTDQLDLTKLPTGMYLVKVFFTEGVVVQRVVKR
jgi:hypothetical protein